MPRTRSAADADAEVLRSFRAPLLGSGREYVLVRFVILRLLGLVYLVAFLVAARQLVPLVGPTGLEPATSLLDRVVAASGSRSRAFVELPTVFVFVGASARALRTVSWIGAALSALVVLGVENAMVNLALWALYMSIVHVGQTFYGFGWELQLLETGMIAVFLCPARTLRPMRTPPPVVTIVLLRWLIVRIMLGAGFIKLRGDPCWRDFTCLLHHYETQPNPSPMSCVLHSMPAWWNKLGVAINHLVELVAPLFAFGPRRLRLVAGALFVAFQLTLILSGNLSFLNWLTIVPALACFDDAALRSIVPERLSSRLPRARAHFAPLAEDAQPSRPHRVASWVFASVVGLLSIEPVLNLLSADQAMNRSFDRLALVNTYGAFGSVGKERRELVIEGTGEATLTPSTRWIAYEFPCKPGDVHRRPCVITPYHYRLDWQLWFAAMSEPSAQPWLVHLVAKLLEGDPTVAPLLARDPFPIAPPAFIRIELYRYEFHRPCGADGTWWTRTDLGSWLRPTARDDAQLVEYLDHFGWEY
ncbi:MAG: lipase maturation factor family protein [Polyangiales bacterium]